MPLDHSETVVPIGLRRAEYAGHPFQETGIWSAWSVLLIYEGVPFLGANMNNVPIRS